MIERRLVIDPQDILHVEVRCSDSKCQAANLIPVRNPDLLVTFKHPQLTGDFNVFTQCFSCGKAFNPSIGNKLRALVHAFAELESSGTHTVRLVARDAQPTATSGQ